MIIGGCAATCRKLVASASKFHLRGTFSTTCNMSAARKRKRFASQAARKRRASAFPSFRLFWRSNDNLVDPFCRRASAVCSKSEPKYDIATSSRGCRLVPNNRSELPPTIAINHPRARARARSWRDGNGYFHSSTRDTMSVYAQGGKKSSERQAANAGNAGRSVLWRRSPARRASDIAPFRVARIASRKSAARGDISHFLRTSDTTPRTVDPARAFSCIWSFASDTFAALFAMAEYQERAR